MTEKNRISAGRDQVLAFRVQQHNLARRLPPGSLAEAAEVCGVRNSPPGSAEPGFHARVSEFTPAQLREALTTKALVEAWSVRSSPFIFTPSGFVTFTLGLLPPDEEAGRFAINDALKGFGVSVMEGLELVSKAMLEALDGRSLTKGELSTAVSNLVPEKLLFWCEPCQAKHVKESLFRLAAQKALICYGGRKGAELLLVLSDQHLGDALPEIEPVRARAEVLRHYLRCYGPSTLRDFAVWGGISPAQAKLNWEALESEMVEVDFEGSKTWLMRENLPALENPLAQEGVRLLPPYDPYLLMSDRQTLLPDKKLHSEVWQIIGNPGIVLSEGQVSGTWRPQKKGKRLLLNITPFRTISNRVRADIEAETATLALVRGCTSSEVKFVDL